MGVVLIHKGAHPLGASLNIPGTGSDGIAPKEPKEAKESKDGGSGSWIALSLPWVPTNQFPEDDLQVASVPSMTVSDRSAVASSAKSNQDRSRMIPIHLDRNGVGIWRDSHSSTVAGYVKKECICKLDGIHC
ncbi:hypothetical protein BASA83_004232 [Batrachochytrium salamandrivorans]|nr:hypothetical protein BASA83_004232 [Batrachochytrium salamandrivorans]